MKDVVQLKLSVIFYEIKKVEKSNLKVIKLRHTDSGPGTWFVYKDSVPHTCVSSPWLKMSAEENKDEMDVDFDHINDDDEEELASGDEEEDDEETKEVYLPGKPLEENEELVCNESAYVMLHQAHTGAPCLSFDILRDDLGDGRETFPLTGYIVAGTQAARTHVNK